MPKTKPASAKTPATAKIRITPMVAVLALEALDAKLTRAMSRANSATTPEDEEEALTLARKYSAEMDRMVATLAGGA